MEQKERNHVTKVEAAKLLGITTKTLLNWVRKGEVKTVVFGLKTRIELTEIERVKKNLIRQVEKE